MTKKTSNISPIVQNPITKEKLSNASKYLETDKDSLEPKHNLDNVEYGKVIVHEYVKREGVIHIIDNTDNNFRVYEILPNGSYQMNDINEGKISKTNGDSLTIVNGDMKLKINDNGKLSIIVNGGNNPEMERVISFAKLKSVLESAIDSTGGPVTYTGYIPQGFTEDNLCYDDIEINTDA